VGAMVVAMVVAPAAVATVAAVAAAAAGAIRPERILLTAIWGRGA